MKRRKLLMRYLTFVLASSMIIGSAVPAFADDADEEPVEEERVENNAAEDQNTDPYVYLDLEKDTEDIVESKTIDQYYDVETENQFKDVTKVKLQWKTTNIKAKVKKNQRWDPDRLEWVDNNGNDKKVTLTHGDEYGMDAVFTLTNLSSIMVNATAAFSVETSVKDTFKTVSFLNGSILMDANGIDIGTVVESIAERTVDKNRIHAATINATLDLAEDAFETLASADNVKYGTYTITLGKTKSIGEKIIDALITQDPYIKVNTNAETALEYHAKEPSPKTPYNMEIDSLRNGYSRTPSAVQSCNAIISEVTNGECASIDEAVAAGYLNQESSILLVSEHYADRDHAADSYGYGNIITHFIVSAADANVSYEYYTFTR